MGDGYFCVTSINKMTPQSWLISSTLLYFLINGAQLFETFVVVPKWTASPPGSFRLLRDRNGLDLKTFWILFHSIHETLFILAIVFCWRLGPVGRQLLGLFILHMGVRMWTIVYFAPAIIKFQKMVGDETSNTAAAATANPATANPAAASPAAATANLPAKTRQWRNYNYLRVGIYILISLLQALLCL